MSVHTLKPRPPLRAFWITAALALIGIALFAAPDLVGWPPIFRGLGIVLLILGLILSLLATLAMRRMRVHVVLDEEGYRVVTPLRTKSGRWEDVTRVTRANQQVILYSRDGSRMVIALPRGGSGDLNALGADIARQLDAHRGYGGSVNIPGETETGANPES